MKVFLKKYQIFISALHLSGLLALLGGCSALVAPDVKSGGSLPDLANLEVCNPALGLADDCSNKAASEVEENVPVTDETEVDSGTILGLIENEDAKIGSFAGKSAYGTYTDAGLIIFVSSQEEYDSRFRKVTEYQCKDCSGDDDPNCKESETSSGTAEYVMISFSKPNAASGDVQLTVGL
jgi:hypothetical protein